MHTFQMATPALYCDEEQYINLSTLVSCNSKTGPITIKKKFADYDVAYRNEKKSKWSFFIVSVDCLRILNKENVDTTNDIKIIKTSLNRFLAQAGATDIDFSMCRIDFCFNTRIDDDNVRACLCSLFNMIPTKSYYQERTEIFDMGIHYKNGSHGFQIYDKNTERIEKKKPIRSFEKNILREEYQVKLGTIKYKQRKGAPRTFDYWVNLDREKEYLELGRKFIPKATFYSMEEAIKIIKLNYNGAIQHKLINYIEVVASAGGMGNVSNCGCKTTINTYIRKLVEIDVNPITIAPEWEIYKIPCPIY